jgi:hypothetical protein
MSLKLLADRCLSARAALNITLLLLVRHVVSDLEEGHLGGLHLSRVFVGGGHGQEGRTFSSARAALGTTSGSGATEDLGFVTRRLLTGELALGLRAEGGGLALPCALRLLAQGAAVGLGGSAGGTADGRAAHGLACRAIFLLAHILGASDAAHRLLAVDFTLGTLSGLAVHLALRSGTDGVALGRAHRVVAEPLALGVALGGRGHSQKC